MPGKHADGAVGGGEVFGRDAELSVLDGFLAELAAGPAALVLEGAAGAGKTTLLRAGVDRATRLGYTVLQTQPSHSDATMAFAGLADLLGPCLDTVLPGLPPPQRQGLAAALSIAGPPSVRPQPEVVAAACLTAVRLLAAQAPVLIVVDDLQWLDEPTGAAAGFALRRLASERAGLLCARRAEHPHGGLPLELDRARLATVTVPVGGVSLGALHHLVRTRLDTSFSRPALRRIHSESGGNPLIALEIARALARRGISRVGGGLLPVPSTISALAGDRLAGLPPPVSRALEVVAVMPDAPTGRYLAAGVPAADLDAAVLAGVLTEEAGRLRFAHPLLSSLVLARTPPIRRRDLHALAASHAPDPEERARHRALAARAPCRETAAELEHAAGLAECRGAPGTAAELAELAATLTPAGQPDDRHRRLLAAARLLTVAGETRAAAAALRQLAALTPPGPRHAEVVAQLGWASDDRPGDFARLLEEALAEAGGTAAPALSATIRTLRSQRWAADGAPARARAEAHRALALAEQAGDAQLLAFVLAHTFRCDVACGAPPDERQLERALALERGPAAWLPGLPPPSQVAGMYLLQAGRLDEAERALRRVLDRAEADGAEYVRCDVLLYLSLIATRRGDPGQGAALARAGLEAAEQLERGQLISALLYACGFAALQAGQPGAVAGLASRGHELSRTSGDRVWLWRHELLLGSLDLALGDAAAAAARLRPLTGHAAELGCGLAAELLPEAAEALIGAGDTGEAAALLAGLAKLAGSHRDPSSAAAAARCRGALAAARGAHGDAVAELTEALRLHGQAAPEPVQHGRTLLLLGAVRRRLKQRRAAREALGAAIGEFRAAGATLWEERAAAELARVSGRAAQDGKLTATEVRVAELIAQGMSNRAAAAELFVTVRAVESTLTKVYAKLGVQSRGQLARHLHAGPVTAISSAA